MSVGKYSIRVDQLVGCALVVPMLAAALSGTRRIRLDATSWSLLALLALNIVSSTLNSPAPAYSVLQTANLAGTWIIYVLVINYLHDDAEMEVFLTGALWSAIAACTLGGGAFFPALAGLRVGGAEVTSAAEDLTNAFGAYGTMIEPNLLGSYSAAWLLVALVLLAGTPRDHASRGRTLLLRWTVGFSALCLLLTFTLAAWLAVLLGGLCVVSAQWWVDAR